MLKHFRKITALVLSAVMALSVSTATVVNTGAVESAAVGSGEALTFGDYEYQVLDDDTVEITGYNGSDANIDIPSEIEGKSVIYISICAFAYCDKLTSVTIPSSVTFIDYGAFKGCSSLTNIKIPDSVSYIVNDAFKGTAWYNNQPDGLVYAGKTAYKFKGEMPANTEIAIKSGTVSISCYAFLNCTNLTSITIPDTVTRITEGAFYGCTGLSSFIIPDSVTSIGASVFEGCTGLTSISIPSNVSEIGSFAFSGCTGLTSVTILDSVINIYQGVFYNCTGLTSIILPNSVKSVWSDAFAGCTNLTTITIPDSVTEIASDAFFNTAWYDNQPDGVVYAGKVAYKYKGEMPENTDIAIKDGTLGIAQSAFYNCNGLTSVAIPYSVENICGGAFSNCSELKAIYVSKDNQHYSSDNGVLFTKNKTSLIIYPKGSNNTEYLMPDSVTEIGEFAFSDCAELKRVTIPSSVKYIRYGAFLGCNALTSVTILNGVTEINDYAFGYYYDPDDWEYSKVSDFTITGYTGTAAETYATDNGFKFIALEFEAIPGDVDGNGKVTLVDAINIQKAALNMLELSGQSLKNADVNGDENVNMLDAILAQKIALDIAINA